MKKKTEEEFVTESKNIHDDFYTYDKVEYINTRTKVIITCPEHGDFKQTPSSHLSGSGCSECRKSKLSNRFRLKKEDVIENIKTANSNIGIKEFDYLNCKVKIPVFCKKCGYEWSTQYGVLLNGHGCPKCAGNVKTEFKDLEEIIKNTKLNAIILSKENEYKNSSTKVLLSCNICNESWSTTYSKIKYGYGCPKCSLIGRSGKRHYNYNENLTREHREGKRLGDGSDNQDKWRRKVFKRDKYTCFITGRAGGSLRAHHLDGYNWNENGRFDINNGITLTCEIHNDFHRIYKKGNNTKEQFAEYCKIYHNINFEEKYNELLSQYERGDL